MSPAARADRPRLQVDVSALVHNWHTVRRAFTGAHVGAVVKNDAYGLGMATVAPVLWQLGCRHFWVARMDEALSLRALLPSHAARILVLQGLGGAPAADFAPHALIPVLTGPHELQALHAAARRGGSALPVAVHLDTGLTRLGFGASELAALSSGAALSFGMRVQTWVGHLGSFDNPCTPQCARQRADFSAWTGQLPTAERSMDTSCSVFARPDWHFDHARVGSALFGVQTSVDARQPLRAVACLQAPVLRVMDVPAGTEIGYAGSYRTPRASRIATVAMGYGDGLPCGLANKGVMYLGDRPAPVVGGVAMGLLGLDVSAFLPGEVQPGQWAEVFGPRQPLERLAASAGLTPNALLATTARLASRHYEGMALADATAGAVSTRERI